MTMAHNFQNINHLILLLTVAIPGEWWSKQLYLGEGSTWWRDFSDGERSLGPRSVHQGQTFWGINRSCQFHSCFMCHLSECCHAVCI